MTIHGLSGYSVLYSLLHTLWLASLLAAFEQVTYHILGFAAGTGCICVFMCSPVVDAVFCHYSL